MSIDLFFNNCGNHSLQAKNTIFSLSIIPNSFPIYVYAIFQGLNTLKYIRVEYGILQART